MSVKYDFGLDEFPNSTVDGGALHEEVDDTTISGFLYVNTNIYGAEVWFGSTLSSGDETSLDGVISTHSGTPLTPPPDEIYTGNLPHGRAPMSDGAGGTLWSHPRIYDYRMDSVVSDEYVQIISSEWANVGDFIFEGTIDTPCTDFEIIGWVTSSGATGYVRLYDYTNNTEVGVITVGGTEKTIHENVNLILPTTGAILEIQMKVTGTGLKQFRMSAVTLH
jgi:hypothetical protein